MMLLYSVHAGGWSRWPRSAAYALLRWAFYRPLRDATEEALVHEARQSSHFLESLRGVQAIKLFNAPGRPAVALHQPGRRHDERRHRDAQARADVRGAAPAAVRAGARRGDLDRRAAGDWTSGCRSACCSRSSPTRRQFALRVSALIDKAVELKMLRLQGERLADIVLTAPERDGAPAVDAADATEVAGIELRDVSFRLCRRRTRGAARRQPAHRAGRVGGHRRPVGLRQDDAAEADAGHPRTDCRARC